MPLNPVTLGIGAAASVPSFVQAYNQNKALKNLLKQGPQDLAPVSFRQMQQGLENQANNAQIAGYGSAIEDINQQQADTLGQARRAALTPGSLLNVLSRLDRAGRSSRRSLAMQGAQMKEARLNRALAARERRAGYQEQGRQEFNRAVGALRGARDQNINAGVQNLLGTGLMSYTPKVPMAPRFTTADIPTTPEEAFPSDYNPSSKNPYDFE